MWRNITLSETFLVSICCATYNHAQFIRQCLDGFIMQKTTFPIEVLIHDDASTDDTADIIREYEKKYPEIIKPIYQIENQYSKGISISRIYNFPRAKGKYIALCEGDDYWIDEYKLQKQIDFLEENDDYSICFHSVKIYDENKKEFINNTIPNVSKITDIKILATGNYINTPSTVYRNIDRVFKDISNFPNFGPGDYIHHMLFAKYGKIYKFSEDMAVYRLHKNGVWELKPIKYKSSIWLKVLITLIYYFIEDPEICNLLMDQYKRINNSQEKNSIPKIGSLYLDTGNGFSEKEKYSFPFNTNIVEIYYQLPKNIRALRLDPIEGHICIINNLEIISENYQNQYEIINGFTEGSSIFFYELDPQILLYNIKNWIKFKYYIFQINDSDQYEIFKNFIFICKKNKDLLSEKNQLIIERDNVKIDNEELFSQQKELNNSKKVIEIELNNLQKEHYYLKEMYDQLGIQLLELTNENKKIIKEQNTLLNSKSWKYTKPFRKINNYFRKNKMFNFLKKF